tara:strand:- start:414 stop:893 length:480 start_codon:yes stop_codon:yes gene_type:complete
MGNGPVSINNLSTTDTLVAADALVVYKNSQGDARRSSITNLQTYMQANLTLDQNTFTTQYSSPLTGATVILTDSSDDDGNIHIIITPSGTISTLTLTLPAVASLVDKQEILFNCTQIVTTLTVGANGATAVLGEPAAFTANGFFRLKYDLLMTTWYTVG